MRGSIGAILLLLLASAAAVAQEPNRLPVLVGPELVMDLLREEGALPVYEGSPECGVFSLGTGTDLRVGGVLVLPSLVGRFGARVGLAIGTTASTFSALPSETARVLDNGTLLDVDRRLNLDTRRLSVELAPSVTVRPLERLSIAIGPTFGWQLSARFSQSESILGPGDVSYSNGARRRDMRVGAEQTQMGGWFGLGMQAAYDLPIGRSLTFVPEIDVRTVFRSTYRETGWRSYAIGIGFALLYDLNPPPAPVIVMSQPLDPPPPTVHRAPHLSANVSIKGIDEQDRPIPVGNIKVNEVLFRQHAPLIPMVFFDRNAATLPDRYAQSDRTGTHLFIMDSLAGLNALEIQHHTMDIIGSRLRRNRSARLALVGSSARDDAGRVARARAEMLRDYLVDVWKIDPSRLSIQDVGVQQRSNESTNDGRADNRRVEFVAGSSGVLAPVVTNQIVRQFNPPTIKLDQGIDAEAGVKEWELVVRQGDRVLARYSSRDSGNTGERDLSWEIAGDAIDSALAPLVAEFTVVDSVGQSVTVRDQVPLKVDRRLSVVDRRVLHDGDREMIGYTIVGFNFNSAELTRRHLDAMGELASSIRPGARVAITGYTDRIGMESRNEELSRHRADRVADALTRRLAALGITGVHIDAAGAGVETVRFGSVFPEARALSRGVYVLVEQTVDAESGPK